MEPKSHFHGLAGELRSPQYFVYGNERAFHAGTFRLDVLDNRVLVPTIGSNSFKDMEQWPGIELPEEDLHEKLRRMNLTEGVMCEYTS